jgi:hypothetical protein
VNQNLGINPRETELSGSWQEGRVIQGRFRGILCDKHEYLLELIRSIHLNPVRAKLVEHPQDWKWSSLAAYLGWVRNEWLYRQDVMELFGGQPDRKLLEFLSQGPQLPKTVLYPGESCPILGGQQFVEEVTKQGEPRRGRRRVYAGRKLSLPKLLEVFLRGGWHGHRRIVCSA